MSAIGLWTGIAVWVLIGGSIAVFLWFVRDLVRLGIIDSDRRGEDGGGELS